MKKRRLPPHGKRRRRLRPPLTKAGDVAYRQLWRLVDGEVMATFRAHPDYVPPQRTERDIRNSITKRVVGRILSWASQREARGRSHSDGRPIGQEQGSHLS